MNKGVFIKDIRPNTQIYGTFAISEPEYAQSVRGPYWRMKLRDCSGSIDAYIWSPASTKFQKIETGILASVKGKVSLYKDKLQIAIEAFEPICESGIDENDYANFIPVSPFDMDGMLAEIEDLCQCEFRYPPWKEIVFGILNTPGLRKAFKTFPAASKIHHAYAGGLLEHSVAVFRLCMVISDQYPELDRQTLLAAALLHDIGKTREFSGGLANEYTTEGKLMGHTFLGVEIIKPFVTASQLEPELAQHLYHLILSHHGNLEFGAVRLPQTAEAFALHYADNMDAKLAQCRAVFPERHTGESVWSAKQPSLERSIFLPLRTSYISGARAASAGDLNFEGGEAEDEGARF